ncbi:MAG: polyprenyl synthetase family protein [Candidatus Nanohaloarchaea archaeon]
MSETLSVSDPLGEGIEIEHDTSFSFEEIERLLSEEGRPPVGKEDEGWIEGVKEVIDDFMYRNIILNLEHPQDIVERFAEEEMGIENPEDARVRDAVRRGEMTDVFMNKGEELSENYKGDISFQEVLGGTFYEDKIEAGIASGIEYLMRGEDRGKRLRPTLSVLTGYALFDGEIPYFSAIVGAGGEMKHAPSLIKDDQMDGDNKRRNGESSRVFSRFLHGRDSWDQTTLVGDIVESWGRQVMNSGQDSPELDYDIPGRALNITNKSDEDLSIGQKKDLEHEDTDLRDFEMEDYKEVIDEKTGALFKASVEPIVETFLDYSDEVDGGRVRELFNTYIDRFNFLFQAGDDANEIFNSGEIGKSITDVVNRKNTFPAIVTKKVLREEEGEKYSDMFLNIFDGTYDRVKEEWTEMADRIGVSLPERMEGDWETEWLNEVMENYEENCSEYIMGYLEEADQAINKLEEMNVIKSDAADKYRELAEFVWTRDY